MKYTIEGKAESLQIKIEQLGDKEQKVLESFQNCAVGNCDCATPQYSKMDSIQILPEDDSVSIELKARTGETINQLEIESCLDYTVRQAAEP